MHGGPVMRKNAIKDAGWIKAYEARNVGIGLACGLSGRAQIVVENRIDPMISTPPAKATSIVVITFSPSISSRFPIRAFGESRLDDRRASASSEQAHRRAAMRCRWRS